MPRSSAVPRTLRLLESMDMKPWIVESFNAFSGRRNDMYGFADIIAINDDMTLAVQVCGADFAPHVKKMTEERGEIIRDWLKGPGRECVLVGWRKVLKKRGGKQRVFKPRIAQFVLGLAIGEAVACVEYKDKSLEEILSLSLDVDPEIG